MLSLGVTAVALPGLSSFSWVTVAIYLFKRCIVAGCIEVEEKPESLDLPYLSLNPPSFIGYVSTGLPATRSWIYTKFGLIFFGSAFDFDFLALMIFCKSRNSFRKPQCPRSKSFPHLFNRIHIFGDF